MIAERRSELAAALDAAADVAGLTYRPSSPRIGDAWPNLAGIERGPGQTLLTSWAVHVWLGADERAAMQAGDVAAEQVFDALLDVAYVDSVSYVQLPTTAGDGIALEFRVRC